MTYSKWKFRTPISLYSLFELSSRTGKETLIRTPKPSDSYIYRAGALWNTARQKFHVSEFTTTPSFAKTTMKNLIFKVQAQGELSDWNKFLNNLSHAYTNIAMWTNLTERAILLRCSVEATTCMNCKAFIPSQNKNKMTSLWLLHFKLILKLVYWYNCRNENTKTIFVNSQQPWKTKIN